MDLPVISKIPIFSEMCCAKTECDAESASAEPAEQSQALPATTIGGFLERMWAYQTIKKELKDFELGLNANGINTAISTTLVFSEKIERGTKKGPFV